LREGKRRREERREMEGVNDGSLWKKVNEGEKEGSKSATPSLEKEMRRTWSIHIARLLSFSRSSYLKFALEENLEMKWEKNSQKYVPPLPCTTHPLPHPPRFATFAPRL
jgi:hypothetical protein